MTTRRLDDSTISLVVHCGACMQTRREMLLRIALAKGAGVPIVNYGMVLAMANGIDVAAVLPTSVPFSESSVWRLTVCLLK